MPHSGNDFSNRSDDLEVGDDGFSSEGRDDGFGRLDRSQSRRFDPEVEFSGSELPAAKSRRQGVVIATTWIGDSRLGLRGGDCVPIGSF